MLSPDRLKLLSQPQSFLKVFEGFRTQHPDTVTVVNFVSADNQPHFLVYVVNAVEGETNARWCLTESSVIRIHDAHNLDLRDLGLAVKTFEQFPDKVAATTPDHQFSLTVDTFGPRTFKFEAWSVSGAPTDSVLATLQALASAQASAAKK